jgi:hypothetical protein
MNRGMTPEALETERARFNELTREVAQNILEDAKGKPTDFRSCWYCNVAHTHLRNREIMLCFSCGQYYMKGYPAVFVVRRSQGEEITKDDMGTFNQALVNAM